eukprot:jgi/Tetstr1/442044/TSEL_030225.t1
MPRHGASPLLRPPHARGASSTPAIPWRTFVSDCTELIRNFNYPKPPQIVTSIFLVFIAIAAFVVLQSTLSCVCLWFYVAFTKRP